MSDPLETLINRLDSVKEKESGKWVARCPAHDDTTPSLAIKQTMDGTVLMRCFAGCSAYEIVNAVGLELSDLFPNRENFDHSQPGKPQRKPFNASDVLRAVLHEITVIAVCADKLRHDGLSPEDSARLTLALQRVFTASAGVV